jgi:N6-adenosine-specific RNA methylase IME4
MSVEFPPGEFGVVYADPPWKYNNRGVPNGGVDQHYDTMTLEEIKSLDVPAADDSVLYLWATVTHLPEALDVLEAWGFEYKTQAMWDKETLGVGYWFRGQHELLLLGVRGDVSPPPEDARRSSVFTQQRGDHSEKPDTVRRHIEQAHPDARKLEMFARDGMEEWELWGDESPERKQSRLPYELE